MKVISLLYVLYKEENKTLSHSLSSGDLQDQIHAQICYIHQDNLVSVLLLDEGAMNWTKNHTTEVRTTPPRYLRTTPPRYLRTTPPRYF